MTISPKVIEKHTVNWSERFKLIYDNLPEGKWTLYFEEVQWLANYNENFVAELKYAWDNFFKNKKRLLIVLCGSSPSFIINKVVMSEALYNRSQYELPLKQLTLVETKSFLGKRSNREIMDAYLLVGGFPEYLKWINKSSSVYTSICKNSFQAGGLFLREHKKIFVSSMSENKHYKTIIKYLAKQRFATRDEILKHIGVKTGGEITNILDDLELCEFIEKYTPFNLGEDSKLARYCIIDPYLQYYYKFVEPKLKNIKRGDYKENPEAVIKIDTFNKWLGFAFERFCRHHHRKIAKILGFGSVHYQSGAFFNRNSNLQLPGYQIDLIFDRDDKVMTLCEIRYLQKKVGVGIIEEFERKLELLPIKSNRTIHKVLITSMGADDNLLRRSYFDDIITIDDFFKD